MNLRKTETETRECYEFFLVVIVVVVTIVVMMVMVMLTGAFAMEFAMALIMPINPSMIAPMPAYPHPFVAAVPIARTIGVIDMIPRIQIDRDPDCLGAWPYQHADRQENHC
jgi:hypothetical protein